MYRARSNSPFSKQKEKRSPFREPSLPQPGESLRDAVFDLFMEKVLVWVAIALTLGAVAGTEWWMRWRRVPLTPWFWTVISAGVGVFAAWRWYRVTPLIEQMVQGLRGEREVGRSLEDFRTYGYRVFHDLGADGFNVDHILVGPGGVFAIETKTISKRSGPDVKIEYDGSRVLIDGQRPDRDPIAQAHGAASHVADVIERKTGRRPFVRPVVLYPGWYITKQPRDAAVWVLNVRAFKAFVEHEPNRLRDSDVALFADALERHMRAARP